jgi:hypothetical protein
MTFRQYCQEKWYHYVDECWDCGTTIEDPQKYFLEQRWFLKHMYRQEVGSLVRQKKFGWNAE